MKEQFNSMQSQFQALITAIETIKDQNQVDILAKTLYNSGILTNTPSLDTKTR
jgi:hypothetical protein